MPVLSSVFLAAALVLAVVLGPQTRAWTWGPAMFALGASVLAALPALWKRGRAPGDFVWLAFGALTVAWFAWRAWVSPVAELGQTDLLLAAAVVAAFISTRVIAGHAAAARILGWTIALLLLANVLVIAKQVADPTFSPVFQARAGDRMITGFFAHYIEAANYLVASSMLVAGLALFGRHALATRVLWFLIACAGITAVWFTRARGGILGGAVACAAFAIVLLIIGKRRNARWFAPALVAIPVIGLGIGAFLLHGWQNAQEARQMVASGDSENLVHLLDNSARLYFLGLAISCIGQHPLAGGGSQSFSWECFRFADGKAQGDIISHKPDLVHNEFLQAATDYGMLGAGLLVVLLGSLVIALLVRLLFENPSPERDARDAWRIGAFAAFAGMLAQSCFSFVFHLMPGILLLGICLGWMSRPVNREPGPATLGGRILVTLAALASAVLLLPAGWTGTRVLHTLWPTHFSKEPATSAEWRIDSLTEAIRLWPQAAFYQERAMIFQSLAGSDQDPGFQEAAERAIEDYDEAARLHPFDPALAVNGANLLSLVKRDAEAERWYAKAIHLQGGMEPGFRGHFSLANHYLRKGLRSFDPQNPEPTHEALELAAEHMENAVEAMHWVTRDMVEPRLAIHESLGTAREAVGDRQGALEAYNFAASLPEGYRAHYRAGVMIGKMAVEAWAKRQPSEALKQFLEARRRIDLARGKLPQEVTLSQSQEYTAYLDRTIAFLRSAKVEPAK